MGDGGGFGGGIRGVSADAISEVGQLYAIAHQPVLGRGLGGGNASGAEQGFGCGGIWVSDGDGETVNPCDSDSCGNDDEKSCCSGRNNCLLLLN